MSKPIYDRPSIRLRTTVGTLDTRRPFTVVKKKWLPVEKGKPYRLVLKVEAWVPLSSKNDEHMRFITGWIDP